MFDRLRAMLFPGASAPAGGGPVPRVVARFDAGSSAPRTRGWNPPEGGPVASTVAGDVIRRRARDAAKNDSAARALVEQWVDDACGWGFTPRSLAKDPATRDRLHELWAEWAETAGSDGEDFAALTATVVRAVVTDGEAFVRLRQRRPEDGLAVPLALELVDSARIQHSHTEALPEGRSIVQGVEFDALVRRVAYHILDHTPGEPVVGTMSATPRRVPAASVLHVFDTEQAGQVRGASMLTTALPRLRTLDSWGDATLTRAHISNLYAAFIRRAGSDGANVNPLTGLPADATSDGRDVISLEPGLVHELAPGEELQFADPPDLPPAMSFATEQLRLACAAAGVPLQVVTGDWGSQNDRLARVVLHGWRRRVERFRWSVLVPRLLRPVWQAWVRAAALGLEGADARATWRAHAWPYIHPVQDVQATTAAVRAGLTSLSAAVAEASGEDLETVLEQQRLDNARADELGLKLDSDGRLPKGGA